MVVTVIIVVGYLLSVVLLIAIGLCLLIAPLRFFILQDRLTRIQLWSKPTATWDAGAGLRWRVTGLS